MKQFRIKTVVKRIGEHDDIYLENSITHEELGKIIDDFLEDEETTTIDISLSHVKVIANRNIGI